MANNREKKMINEIDFDGYYEPKTDPVDLTEIDLPIYKSADSDTSSEAKRRRAANLKVIELVEKKAKEIASGQNPAITSASEEKTDPETKTT